jgi:mercuric ion binding protein
LERNPSFIGFAGFSLVCAAVLWRIKMMKTEIFCYLLAFAVISGSALAESRKVTLDIRNMSCAVCPITVKKALEQVSGVQHVSVDYASKTATVQFDGTLTAADKLTDATQAAGYPSTVTKVRE